MSGTSARAGRFTSVAALAAATIGLVVGSAPTGATTPPPPTPPAATAAAAPAPTTVAAPPTTAAPATAGPTTFPGPVPRESARVASPIDIAKIRATSLPLRRMGIGVAIGIALLAVAGFVYGKLRSRIPPVKVPELAAAGVAPAPAPLPAPHPLPPPAAIPLPPPVVEDAVADTVIFEPPTAPVAPPAVAPGSTVPDVRIDAVDADAAVVDDDNAEPAQVVAPAPEGPDRPPSSSVSDSDGAE